MDAEEIALHGLSCHRIHLVSIFFENTFVRLAKQNDPVRIARLVPTIGLGLTWGETGRPSARHWPITTHSTGILRQIVLTGVP